MGHGNFSARSAEGHRPALPEVLPVQVAGGPGFGVGSASSAGTPFDPGRRGSWGFSAGHPSGLIRHFPGASPECAGVHAAFNCAWLKADGVRRGHG